MGESALDRPGGTSISAKLGVENRSRPRRAKSSSASLSLLTAMRRL